VPMLMMARFFSPVGIAVTKDGSSLFVADAANCAIRMIRPMQDCITVAGAMPATPGTVDGIGNVARFNLPFGITVDQGGRVIVTECNGQAIRVGVPVP